MFLSQKSSPASSEGGLSVVVAPVAPVAPVSPAVGTSISISMFGLAKTIGGGAIRGGIALGNCGASKRTGGGGSGGGRIGGRGGRGGRGGCCLLGLAGAPGGSVTKSVHSQVSSGS